MSTRIDSSLVQEMLKEYLQAKESNWLQDPEKAILHSAKFSEILMAVLVNMTEKRILDINKLSFDSLFNSIINKPKPTAEFDILTLAIPRVAASVYSIRNKKRVAHVKSIDPDFLDSVYCTTACDWMLAELVMLIHTSDPKQAKMMIDSIIEKSLPLVEEFEDGSIVVLRRDLRFNESVLVVLYHFYPDRLSNEELRRQTKPKYAQLLTTTLGDLEREKLIHRNVEGSKLTKLGVDSAEKLILSNQ